jgi:hypothetical protein
MSRRARLAGYDEFSNLAPIDLEPSRQQSDVTRR